MSSSSEQQQLAASELSRRQYLAALGMVQYEARVALPHARPSPSYDWAELAEQDVDPAVGFAGGNAASSASSAVQPAAKDSQVHPSARANKLLGAEELAALRITPPAEFAGDTVVQGVQASRQQGRFSLFVSTAINGRMLVLQPERAQTWLSANEQRLADDLFKALAQNVTASSAGHYFHWPLLPSPGQPQGAEQPPEAFRGFIEAVVQRDNVQLLLFAGESARQVFDMSEQQPVFAWSVAGRSIPVCLIPPLAQMLADWRAKAQTWQRLRSCLYG